MIDQIDLSQCNRSKIEYDLNSLSDWMSRLNQ